MRDSHNLAGVLLIDAGIAAGLLGLVSLVRPLRFLGIRTRRQGAAWLASGAALGLAGVALPAPSRRVPETVSRLDEIIPIYQFSEHHEIRVRASPERVHEAVWKVTPEEIQLFQALTWLRSPRLSREAGEESILNAPARKPILEVATSSGFLLLADQPGHETVVGMVVIAPSGPREPFADPQDLIALAAPGYAKAVMNFRMEDAGGGWTRLTTETRVWATDASSRRRFAAYWRTIYPGSALIRRTWLRAIRERAEGRSRD
jgi:hypothetical protein